MEFREITAKTVDEAITKACLELETSSDNLEIQVVREGTSGFFGIGSKPAIIKVRKKVEEEEFDILKELKKEETKKERKEPVHKEPKKEVKKDTPANVQHSAETAVERHHKKTKGRGLSTGKKVAISVILVLYVLVIVAVSVVVFYRPRIENMTRVYYETVTDTHGNVIDKIEHVMTRDEESYNILLLGHDRAAMLTDVFMLVVVAVKNTTSQQSSSLGKPVYYVVKDCCLLSLFSSGSLVLPALGIGWKSSSSA